MWRNEFHFDSAFVNFPEARYKIKVVLGQFYTMRHAVEWWNNFLSPKVGAR